MSEKIGTQNLDLLEMHRRYVVQGDVELLQDWQENALSHMVIDGQQAQQALNQQAEIPPAEQRQLQHRIRDGETAFNIFFAANVDMVGMLANKLLYRGFGKIEPDDLMQVGKIELARCIQAFDPTKNLRFSTYAFRNIRGRIKSFILENRRTITQSATIQTTVQTFRKRVDIGEDPEAVARSLRLSLNTILEHELALNRPDAFSYDNIIDPETGTTLLDTLPADNRTEELVIARTEAAALLDGIRAWLANRSTKHSTGENLDPDRAYKILVSWYGYGLSGNEIAEQLGVSKQRVSRVVHQVETLRDSLPSSIRRQAAAQGYRRPKSTATNDKV
jgi:RNA polymerase sigma factor (sigma-70 family)